MATAPTRLIHDTTTMTTARDRTYNHRGASGQNAFVTSMKQSGFTTNLNTSPERIARHRFNIDGMSYMSSTFIYIHIQTWQKKSIYLGVSNFFATNCIYMLWQGVSLYLCGIDASLNPLPNRDRKVYTPFSTRDTVCHLLKWHVLYSAEIWWDPSGSIRWRGRHSRVTEKKIKYRIWSFIPVVISRRL